MVFNAAGFPLLPFLFRRTGSITLIANLYVLIGTIGVAIVVYFSGGLESPTLPWFAVLPIGALLLGGTQSGWLWTIVAVSLTVTTGLLEMAGHPFPVSVDEDFWHIFSIGDQAGLVLIIFVIALIFQREKQRAFAQLSAANEELAATLDDLRQTQRRLIHTEKMASLGQITAGIAHEIKNPLNFVNNFAALSVDLVDEMREVLRQKEMPEAFCDVLEDLQLNAAKIQEHGARADGIVKSMMVHSRTTSSRLQPTDLNRLLSQYVDLAYHGKRAEWENFHVDIRRDFDEQVGDVYVIPEEIGRVFLNLLDNALYAVWKKSKEAGPTYTPRVAVSSRKEESGAVVRIADNGQGIPEDIREKVLEPFYTTKPTGEGTGLGLSLSFEIITQGHGGTLSVEKAPQGGAMFVVTLPAE